MSIVIIIVLILLGLFGVGVAEDSGCSSDADGCVATVPVSTWTPVEVDGIAGVIVPEQDGALFLGARAYWTPAPLDIDAAERAIAADQGELDHMRQYVGFIEDGERKIYINGFEDALGIDWQSEPVFVEDGGETFFSAVYNVDTDELESFAFNGEA